MEDEENQESEMVPQVEDLEGSLDHQDINQSEILGIDEIDLDIDLGKLEEI